ncbi:MAG TPA: dihydrofolate reductase [Acidiferrobacter sp.]|nr:dihydrofolate reductase [Acidiferrobacter sp.]
MTLTLIVAVAHNGVIGQKNTLPWRLPDDLRRFRGLTLHHSVIMGRRTFESLPGPLVDRHCIVVSRDTGFLEKTEGVEVAPSIEEALGRARSDEIFVAGGASLYAQTLARADRLYLTEVQADIVGDAFFPSYDQRDWREVASEAHVADARHSYAFRFVTLERNR